MPVTHGARGLACGLGSPGCMWFSLTSRPAGQADAAGAFRWLELSERGCRRCRRVSCAGLAGDSSAPAPPRPGGPAELPTSPILRAGEGDRGHRPGVAEPCRWLAVSLLLLLPLQAPHPWTSPHGLPSLWPLSEGSASILGLKPGAAPPPPGAPQEAGLAWSGPGFPRGPRCGQPWTSRCCKRGSRPRCEGPAWGPESPLVA